MVEVVQAPRSASPGTPRWPRWSFLFFFVTLAAQRLLLSARFVEQGDIAGQKPGAGVAYDLFVLALLFALRAAIGWLPGRWARRTTMAALGALLILAGYANHLYFRFFRSGLELWNFEQAGDLLDARASIPALAAWPETVGLLLVPLLLLGWALRRDADARLPVRPSSFAALAGILALGLVANWRGNSLRPNIWPHPLRTNTLMRWGAQLSKGGLRAQAGPRAEPAWLKPEAVRALFSLPPGGRSDYPLLRRFSAPDREQRLAQAGWDLAALGAVGHRPNIVVIMMESLRAYEMGAYGAPVSATPRLDAVAREAYLLRRAYAVSHMTIRGDFATLCSFYPNPVGKADMTLQPEMGVRCLPSVLGEAGYRTYWFYGYKESFENEGYFWRAHGVQEIVDRAAYPRTAEGFGVWGLSDQAVLDGAAERLERAPQPFLAVISTLSNHHPYAFPDHHPLVPPLRYAGGYGEYFRGAGYSDAAVGRFLEQAREKPYFRRTIFVILADHGVWIVPDDRDVAEVGDFKGEARPVEIYHRIPLLFLAPALLRPGASDRVATQIDVAPSLLDVLGLEAEVTFVGRSMFDPRPPGRLLLASFGGWHGIDGDLRCWQAGSGRRCFRWAGDLLRGPEPPPAAFLENDELPAWATRAAAVSQALLRGNRLYPRQ